MNHVRAPSRMSRRLPRHLDLKPLSLPVANDFVGIASEGRLVAIFAPSARRAANRALAPELGFAARADRKRFRSAASSSSQRQLLALPIRRKLVSALGNF